MRMLFGIAVLLAGGFLSIATDAVQVQVPDAPVHHQQPVGWVGSLGVHLE